jgi:hypothetical protein
VVATLGVTINKNDLKRLADAAPDEADRAIRALAEDGRTYAILLINASPATGRVYTRGSVTHTASSPGEAPRSDIGTLVNSIHVESLGKGRAALVDGVEYGEWLEFGTDDMAARPFFGPAAFHMEQSASSVFDGFLENT